MVATFRMVPGCYELSTYFSRAVRFVFDHDQLIYVQADHCTHCIIQRHSAWIGYTEIKVVPYGMDYGRRIT